MMIDVPPFLLPQVRPITSNYTATLDAVEEHIAFVLPVPKTGTLKKVGWQVGAVSSPVLTARVSIETVAESVGAPVATTDAAKTLYATGAVSADLTSFSTGVRFDAINGTSGITVTKGDDIAIVISCVSLTSGSIGVRYSQYSLQGFNHEVTTPANIYTYTYLGGVAGQYGTPILLLEYDDGLVHAPFIAGPYTSNTYVWDNSDNPNRRGLKIRAPFRARVIGIVVSVDNDDAADLIIYDRDEYSVLSTIALSHLKRKNVGNGSYLTFITPVIMEANSWYRVVLLPQTTTNISTYVYTIPDDGSFKGLNSFQYGTEINYTYRNGAPSSSDHAWTDVEAIPSINLLIDQIDTGFKNTRWRHR